MNELLAFAQNASPIAIIAILAIVIFYMVRNERALQGTNRIAKNHTSCLPEMLDSLKRMESSLVRVEQEMNRQSNMLTEIRVKINGK